MNLSVILEKISGTYFFLSLFIFLFFVKPGGESTSNIDFPHILVDFTVFIPIFILEMLIFLFLLFTNKIKFDVLSILLIARLFLPLIPLVYEPQVLDFNGNIAILATAAIGYLIAKTTIKHFAYIRKYLVSIFLILCIQTMIESYLGTYSFFDDTYLYKNDLILPIGGSNAIASDIVPLGCLIYCTENKRLNKFIYAFIMLFVVVLTKSRSGMIVSIIMIAIMEAWSRRSSIKTILSLFFTVSIAIFGGIYFITNTEVGNSAFTQNDSTVLGRLFLINHGLDLFFAHPIFGSGFADSVVMYNPHNYIVYTLMAFGIFGLLIFSFITLFVMKNLFQNSNDIYIRGTICFISCLLVQGLGEIVIYTPVIEFMTWFILGAALGRIKMISDNNLNGENNGRCVDAELQ